MNHHDYVVPLPLIKTNFLNVPCMTCLDEERFVSLELKKLQKSKNYSLYYARLSLLDDVITFHYTRLTNPSSVTRYWSSLAQHLT